MALFCILAAPLIMGNDVRHIISSRARHTLLNTDAIAVNQDPLGTPGFRVSPYSRTGVELWARKIGDGNISVALVNKGDAAADVTLELTSLVNAGFEGAVNAVRVFDIFAQADVGTVEANGSWCFSLVEPHGVKFLRLAPLSPGVVPKQGLNKLGMSKPCPKHPPAPPGPSPGPFPPFSPTCPGNKRTNTTTPPHPSGWSRAFDKTYSDQDCPNLGNHMGMFNQCAALCERTSGCTAMNWGGASGGACALRGCREGQVPTGPILNGIHGYLRCSKPDCLHPHSPSPSPLPPLNPPAPPMPETKLMDKIGAYVMQAAETTPVVWKGRTLLVQTVSGNTPGVYGCCVCRTFGCVDNASAPIGYSDCSGCDHTCNEDYKRWYGSCTPQFIQLVDFATLEVLVSPIPGTEAFTMASATVFKDTLYVYATNGVNTSRVSCFSSSDPTNTTEGSWDAVEVLHMPPGLVVYNTDVHHTSAATDR